MDSNLDSWKPCDGNDDWMIERVMLKGSSIVDAWNENVVENWHIVTSFGIQFY